MPIERDLVLAPLFVPIPKDDPVARLYDLDPDEAAKTRLKATFPDQLRPGEILVIVGPSGSGKTTWLTQQYHHRPDDDLRATTTCPILDIWRESLNRTETAQRLIEAGLNSPRTWLRPASTMSNGEYARLQLAARIIRHDDLITIDELGAGLSELHAQTLATSVQKTIRRNNRAAVITTHSLDVAKQLQPTHLLDLATGALNTGPYTDQPQHAMQFFRCKQTAWRLFAPHHYLSAALRPGATSFLCTVDQQPAAFTAWIQYPHRKQTFWHEHRTVVLPDWQGIGIGSFLVHLVASALQATRKSVVSTAGHPAVIAHRINDPAWRQTRDLSPTGSQPWGRQLPKTDAHRLTASWIFQGSANHAAAREWKLIT